MTSNITSLRLTRRCETCLKEVRPRLSYHPIAIVPSRAFSSSSSSTTFSRSIPKSRIRFKATYLLVAAIPIAFLPFTWFSSTQKQSLSPQIYSNQKVGSISKLTSKHALLAIPIPKESIPLFEEQAVRRDGTTIDEDEIVIQHVMIKNPDLQIERPYTPINDVGEEGEMKLVVKRVKGGEVGRMVHLLKPGMEIGIRGPITTFSLRPNQYDKIVMISTGTGIAPFLQFLSKLHSNSNLKHQSQPKLELIHSQPNISVTSTSSTTSALTQDTSSDFTSNDSLLPAIISRHPKLIVQRPPPGPIPFHIVKNAISGKEKGERVLVLVCLPPSMMRPLCGGLTLNLDQGPITGILGELGLTNAEVWKLE